MPPPWPLKEREKEEKGRRGRRNMKCVLVAKAEPPYQPMCSRFAFQ